MMIETYDDLISEEDVHSIYSEVTSLSYRFFETDDQNGKVTGSSCKLSNGSFTLHLLTKTLINIFPEFPEQYTLDRAYVNCFVPGENPCFHRDSNISEDRTLIYYANPLFDYDIDEGGTTDFLDAENRQLKSVFPIAGRICIFDSSIYHKANSFRDAHRYTVALKLHHQG